MGRSLALFARFEKGNLERQGFRTHQNKKNFQHAKDIIPNRYHSYNYGW